MTILADRRRTPRGSVDRRNQPYLRIIGGRRTAANGDRIVATETRLVVAGIVRKCGPVSGIADW